jgi:hypothetical protein
MAYQKEEEYNRRRTGTCANVSIIKVPSRFFFLSVGCAELLRTGTIIGHPSENKKYETELFPFVVCFYLLLSVRFFNSSRDEKIKYRNNLTSSV